MSNFKAVIADKKAMYRAIFDTPNGKKVFEDLCQELNPDEIFKEGSADGTAFNLGKRYAFNYIKSIVED